MSEEVPAVVHLDGCKFYFESGFAMVEFVISFAVDVEIQGTMNILLSSHKQHDE